MINKVDLVDAPDVDALTARLRELNTTAEIVTSSYAQVDLDRILGIGANEFAQILVESDGLQADAPHADEHAREHDDHAHEAHAHGDDHDHHEHDASVSSVGIEVDADVDLDALEAWLGELRRADTANLFRMKASWPCRAARSATCCRACTA